MSNPETVAVVTKVLVTSLGIEDRADTIDASTGLLGELPELDSLGVLELVTALEEEFGVTIDDEDFSGEVFETVGTLADFLDEKRSEQPG